MGGLLLASTTVGGLLAASGAGLRGRICGPPTSPYTAGIPNLNAENIFLCFLPRFLLFLAGFKWIKLISAQYIVLNNRTFTKYFVR